MKRSRKVIWEPKPTWVAIRPTGCPVVSRRHPRPAYAAPVQPLKGGRAGLLAEAPVEGSRAHRGPVREVDEGEVAVDVLLHPPQQRFEARPFRAGLLVHDELGLPAVPLQGHHGHPRGVGCHRRTVVLPDHVPADDDAEIPDHVMQDFEES